MIRVAHCLSLFCFVFSRNLFCSVEDFSHKPHQFKVDVNAKQLRLTGCAILWENLNIVIAEGGLHPISIHFIKSL